MAISVLQKKINRSKPKQHAPGIISLTYYSPKDRFDKKDLIRVLKPEGHLFLTGVLQERDNLFFEKFIEANPNLKVIKRIQKDEWVGYWVQKIPQA